MNFLYALVRQPSPKMAEGLLTHLDQSDLKPDLALEQWYAYCNILRDYTEVIEVEPTPECPDSIFVEDTVFVYDNLAVRTRLHESRRDEQASVISALAERGLEIVDLPEGAKLEGGDVLKFDGHVWVGLSTRTNQAGVDGLAEILETKGVGVTAAPVRHALHLKSCLTALPDGAFISHEDYSPPAEFFPGLQYVPEFLGSQVVLLGGRSILMSESAPRTAELLHGKGFDVITTPLTEIEKMEGSATCLSVRVRG